MDNGQKKAAGEIVADMGTINQAKQNNDPGAEASGLISFFKHVGKLLKTPFFFSAPPSQVVDFAKQINEKSTSELDAILNGQGNCLVLGTTCPVSSLQTQFGTAEQTRSPLILDLDGLNGVETLGKTAGIYFDHDGNKFAEQSGWVGQNDGMLVWDRNGNGQIDNGAELFGNNTVLNNGSKAANGFTALDGLDSNHDHVIDAQDQDASNLRVFKDANSNGVVDAGELLTLAEAGVKSLNTGYKNQTTTDANGNQHLQAGSFTTTAGQTRAMDDVWFAVDTALTIDKDLVAVNSTIAALPDIEGFGNVHSLHQAMARDASGKLQAVVQQYAAATDPAVRASLLNDLIYHWAGVQDIDPASRAATQIYGNAIGDARKLATLETFLGQGYLGTWCGGTRDPNPHGQAAPILLGAYEQLSQWIDGQLLTQTLFKPLYESIGLRYNPDDQSLDWDVSALVATLKTQYDTNQALGQVLMLSFGGSLGTMEEAGAQISAKLRQQGDIKGQGFELYLAVMGSNPLVGTAGADTLHAKAGLDNVFSAGRGADILNGGTSSDIFLWSRGSGNDTINEVGGVSFGEDALQFLDVNAPEVRLSRWAADLYITIGAEQIKVVNHFGSAPAALEQVQFSDGRIWQKSVLDAAPSLYLGTGENETLWGTSLADVLEGGKGTDTLYGGAGSDTYTWLKGDGNDTINDLGAATDLDTLKLADIKAAEAVLSRDTANLYVTIGNEKITIKDYFAAGYLAAPIEQVLFADDGKWKKTDLDAACYRGGDGADVIYGSVAAETFIGGKGADTLYGGAGGDTYTWLKGDGNDTINDIGAVRDIDTLKLADVKAVDAVLSRDTANLYVTIGTERITVKDHFAAYMAAPIEQILFSDGGKWQKADLDAALYRGGDGNDTIYGTASAETFLGGKGADTLYGGAGGDTYTWLKGDGHDTIHDLGAIKDIDTLKLADVKATDAQLSRDTANLYVTIGTERITVKDHFAAYMAAPIEQILFSDGGKWQKADLDAALYRGGDGDDTIYGTASAETFLGGKGADTLYGGAGGDTYTWLKGGGNDTINDIGVVKDVDTLKLADVKAADVLLSRDTANLYVTIGTERITVKDHFAAYMAAPIEQILFSDGGKWQKADLDAALYRGGDGDDTIYGTASAETFLGGKGADTLYGGAGGDTYTWLKGDGNDTINDIGAVRDIDTLKLADVKAVDAVLSRDTANLYVTIGTERITVKDHFAAYMAAPIEQILFSDGGKWQKADLDAALYRGGDGDDTIYGSTAAEGFLGGKGADTLYGGAGGDTYIWLKGGGNDTINDIGAVKDVDTLKLADVKAADVLLSRDTANLYVTIGAEKITIKDHFAVGYSSAPIEQILFADGGKWQKADLDLAPYRGTAAKDTIYGTAQAEVFIGGAGADTLVGGAGSDTYQVARGDGADTLQDVDFTTGNKDMLQFLGGVTNKQLWFRHMGNDLEVSIIGTADKATVQNWYSGNAFHVEQLKAGDGKVLLDTQVEALVQAMAGFSPPAMGQIDLSAAYAAQLAPVLAANWS
jgi:Ca2+-binding RTX toxin-like protein